MRLGLLEPVPQPPRHRPRPRHGFIGRAVEDGLPSRGSRIAGREPVAPVAGLRPPTVLT
jgi:hypothetical protein